MSHHALLFLALSLLAALFTGCGESNVAPKTELTEKDKQQIEEYQQQATDEWGNKK